MTDLHAHTPHTPILAGHDVTLTHTLTKGTFVWHSFRTNHNDALRDAIEAMARKVGVNEVAIRRYYSAILTDCQHAECAS